MPHQYLEHPLPVNLSGFHIIGDESFNSHCIFLPQSHVLKLSKYTFRDATTAEAATRILHHEHQVFQSYLPEHIPDTQFLVTQTAPSDYHIGILQPHISGSTIKDIFQNHHSEFDPQSFIHLLQESLRILNDTGFLPDLAGFPRKYFFDPRYTVNVIQSRVSNQSSEEPPTAILVDTNQSRTFRHPIKGRIAKTIFRATIPLAIHQLQQRYR